MDISEELKTAARELSSLVGVPIDVQSIRRKPFDGAEVVMCVISVLIGTVGKAVLSNIGADLWKGLKTIVHRSKSEAHLRVVTTLAVDYESATGTIRYSCQIEQEGDVDRFAASLTMALNVGGSASHGDSQRRLEFALQPNGEWKELVSRPGFGRR